MALTSGIAVPHNDLGISWSRRRVHSPPIDTPRKQPRILLPSLPSTPYSTFHTPPSSSPTPPAARVEAATCLSRRRESHLECEDPPAFTDRRRSRRNRIPLKITKMRIRKASGDWLERAEAEFKAAESEFIHISQYEPPPPQRLRRLRGRPTQYDTVDLLDNHSKAPQQRTVNTGGRPVRYDNSEAPQQPRSLLRAAPESFVQQRKRGSYLTHT